MQKPAVNAIEDALDNSEAEYSTKKDPHPEQEGRDQLKALLEENERLRVALETIYHKALTGSEIMDICRTALQEK